jgi:hypothetical protein
MSLLPAHSRRNGGADDPRPAGDASADSERPATAKPASGTLDGETGQQPAGRSPERPRYAFAYAPADDAPDDDATDDNYRDDSRANGGSASNGGPGRTVVAGDVVTSDTADEREDDEPAVTRPSPAPVPPAVPTFTAAPLPAEVPATGMHPAAPRVEATPVLLPRTMTERETAATAATDAAGLLDEPLLADAAALRARWQRAQSDFVDDPQAAVADAAALVAQTAQAMIDALEQRQRQLRQEWERARQRERGQDIGQDNGQGNGQGNGSAASDPGDTERLRLTMRRYRALFNQICPR